MTRTLATCAAAALLLALSGCSSDPEPKFAEPSEIAEPSTTASDAAMPTPRTSSFSPEKAVDRWIASFNQLVSSGDGELIRSRSAESCATCENLIAPFEKIYNDGGSITTEGWRSKSTRRLPDFEDRRLVVSAIDISPGETTLSSGAAPTTTEAEKSIVRFSLVDSPDGWLIAKVVFLS